MTASAAVPLAGSPTEPFLRLAGLRKAYPGVVALADFSMDVHPGEVIGLVGENGAGKSTLMKILGGVIAPDRGTIAIDGVPYDALTVGGSMRAGIAFVHQELNLFDNLDVAANIFIGREPRRGGLLQLVDNDKLHSTVKPFLDRLGANFSPSTLVSHLSLAQQQMVEIAKALSFNSRLVILDEPTSSLPIAETEKLLQVIRGLKAEGISVIFISHRLNEIVGVCDRVVVLRDGRKVGTLEGDAINHDAMVKLMVGRDLRVAYAPPNIARGAVALSAHKLRTGTYPHREIDLDLHAGEILGLAGLVGAGRTELARVAFGIDSAHGGHLRLDGQPIRLATSADAVKAGIFLVPEDRKGTGLVLDLTITENISLPNLPAYARNRIVSRDAEAKQAEVSKRELDIRAADLGGRAASLSGGNQQKVVLAKWLAMTPRVMIFDEPTRGIDIGAKSEIYKLMRLLADQGVAVLMISSDMEEVIGVSDRVAVMHEGHITGILDRDQSSEENILRLAVGRPLH
ncbi:MAG: sugar ABC transporter ATP-binding protein [Devosia nanyangense]|uniref:Sugar ABC transporter ATP-binding protein n=1 Tax=Devosia nanyangense TaxID=1228055 RepID=A0A933NXB5_9HYPH|nr:sugar ABC transporter ATP-binding protein [Devosia nanyangense]